LAYLLVFAAAAVGTGLVRTVTTTYLPLLLADIRDAPALIGLAMMVNSAAGFHGTADGRSLPAGACLPHLV
jgi:hypothetical protein